MAFTGFFLAQANDAYTKSDSQIVKPLVLDSCKTCSSMITTLDGYKSNNYKYVGDFITPTYSTINTYNGGDVSVLVSSDTKSSKIFGPTGSLIQEIPGAKGNVVVQLDWNGSDWRVSGIKGA